MNQYILVINAGSSSIKFRVYTSTLEEKVNGICERIGIDGVIKVEYEVHGKKEKVEEKANFKNHDDAISNFLEKLVSLKIIEDMSQIKGIGHRIVQGAEITKSCLIDEKVLEKIEWCIKLAPLHNKPELDVIKILMSKVPTAKNVAVFDTSFHTTIPKENSYYAVPKEWIEKHQVKRYGFHGTSYRYVTEKMQKILDKENQPINLIICHLGNGASICCVKDSKSYDTTMGLTPLAGLVMGTRSGDIDPSILDYIAKEEGLSAEEITNKLNKESGLKGICGSSDFRDIQENLAPGNDYEFAVNLFVQRIVNYISIYKTHLRNAVDAIVFTGGIGENSPEVRKLVCDKLGINLSERKNTSKIADYSWISVLGSRPRVYVVRTNEELKIAQDTNELTN